MFIIVRGCFINILLDDNNFNFLLFDKVCNLFFKLSLWYFVLCVLNNLLIFMFVFVIIVLNLFIVGVCWMILIGL